MMLNQQKKNNGWILCPSKTFPGKFYYFNVVNGEAAWSLNEIENQTSKRNFGIHKITDKSHSFPEPSSPPMDDAPNISFANNAYLKKANYNTIPKRVINNIHTPSFGQAIFPKYVEPYMPNIIWAPIQIPPPMYVTSGHDIGLKMPNNQIIQSREPDRSLFVQACDVSLSKRFEMLYAKPFLNSKPKAGIRDLSNRFYNTSTPIKSGSNDQLLDNSQIFGRENASVQKPKGIKPLIIREPILKRPRTSSASVNENDSRVLSSFGRTNSAESLLSVDNTYLMKSSLNGGNKIENSNDTREKLNDLDHSDLRFLLVAKRRKSVDLSEDPITSEGKKIKTTKVDGPKTTPKKRVTFDLGDLEQVTSEVDEDQITEGHIEPQDVECQNDQEIEDSVLYIAVDVDTLLDEYEFIEEYVQSDDSRRLLIPQKLQAEVEAVCLGDCRGRQRVIAARQITRKLVSPPDHYVLLPDPETTPDGTSFMIVDNYADNYILNNCLQVLNAGDKVMLITNNTDLRTEAKTLNIDCFKTQELVDGAGVTKPEVSFDLKKIKLNVSNEKKTNLFLQPASEFEPYIIKNKNEIKKSLFEDSVQDYNDSKAKTTTSNLNSNIQNVQTDRLVDITRRKLPNMPSLDNPTTQIGLDMQNLFIKDRPKKPNELPTEKQNPNVRFENGSNFEKKREKVSEPESDVNSLDCYLSVYCVKNKDMEENIKMRLDEFTCCFAQIMEDALVDVLVCHSPITDHFTPPWMLYEAVRRTQELYGSHAEVQITTEKLEDMLLKHSSQTGKLKSSIKPNDLVQMVGCGLVLLETLQSFEPSLGLQDACTSISELLQAMSKPPVDASLVPTPVLTRGEQDPSRGERGNYIKKPSEIVEYLKAHFADWKDFETPPDYDTQKQPPPKVVRTFGRDLSLLKIAGNKSITMNNRTNNTMNAVNDNIVIDKAQKTTKIDGIATIQDEKLPQINATYNGGNNGEFPIVVRKFENSFVFKLANDKNKPWTRNHTDIEESLGIPKNNEDIPTFKELIEQLPTFNDLNKNGPKIVRLFDNIFKQNDNEVTTTRNDYFNVPKHGNTFNQNPDSAGPKVIRTFDNLFSSINNNKSAIHIIDDLNIPKHGNTFNQDKETAGPKMIRNIKPIEEFEGKLKENPKMLDLDALDYSEMDISSPEEKIIQDESSAEEKMSFVYAIKKQERKISSTVSNDKTIGEINDNAFDNDYTNTNIKVKSNENIIINDNANDSVINVCNSALVNESDDRLPVTDDITSDSGFENDSIQAYSLVKLFLAELSESVKALYDFIAKSINEFREDNTQEEKRRLLHEKANRTHLVIASIIDRLQSIIQRESNDGLTVRSVLLKAGVQASSDKRMTRYRQVVMKCLEQAQMLEAALRSVLALHEDLDASVSSHCEHDGIRYFNIFE